MRSILDSEVLALLPPSLLGFGVGLEETTGTAGIFGGDANDGLSVGLFVVVSSSPSIELHSLYVHHGLNNEGLKSFASNSASSKSDSGREQLLVNEHIFASQLPVVSWISPLLSPTDVRLYLQTTMDCPLFAWLSSHSQKTNE